MFFPRTPLIGLLVFVYLINLIACSLEFTNLQCNSLDSEFSDFEYCFLKSVNRTYKYFSLKVNLFKKPITKIKVNIALLKRYSGYKLFLYNVTVDACRFLKNPKSNPVGVFLYEFFRDHSNMNHSCPYNHDLVVEKLTIDFANRYMTEFLPFPSGDYLLQSNWIAYDINRAKIVSKVEFTNIKCTSLDPDFDEIDYCFIKSVNRSYKYLSLKVKLLKTPITKVKVNIALFKRYNGYRPFMYNVTVDACRFLNNQKSNQFVAYFYGFFSSYSNMNHSCPYDHDLVVEKVSISFVDHRLTEILPFPTGDYLLQTNWMAYDINRAFVNIYFTLS